MKQNLLKSCLVMLLAVLGWGNAWADEVTFTFKNVASDLSWANGVAQTNVTLGNFTFAVSGGGNNGKYYESDTTWRFYSGGGLTITPAAGYTITSVSSKPSQTFAVAEGVASTSFSGTVKFTSITINYTTSGGGSTPEPTTYTVTVANNITGGTVTANPTTAAANATVTLTATPATGYEFGAWDVKDASNNTITVTDNKFTMPAANVNVSATFNAKAARPENEIFYESFDTNDGTGGNDDKWSGSIASNNIKQDNDGWIYANEAGANKCAKFGAGSKLGSATTPALGQACDATLTFKAAAWNNNSESTTLKLSVIGGGTISRATVTMTKGAWSTFTATLTSLTADSKIKFEGNAASNSRFFLDEVSVVKTGNATPVKAVTSIAVKTAPTKVAYTEGDKFAPAGLVITATYNIGEPEDVAYAGNESKFSFEPSLSTALTAENTAVTITYGGKTATQAISVEAFSIANTQETAYTVAEAIALIDAGKSLATPVYVKGTVSKVVTAFNASYGNISVNISADGETTGAQFQLYRNFKGANNQKWTSATEAPEVGDQVVAYGTLIKYNTTYEMAEGNYVVSIVKKNPIVKYNITVAEGIENGTVTASAEKAEEGDVITLTATPAEGYKFEAWSVKGADNSTISVASNMFTMPAQDVTVSATFKADEPEPEPTIGESETFDFAAFEQGNDVTIEAANYTISLHKNTGSTVPQWNANSSEARVYAKGSVDITSELNIVKVVYDYAVNANKNNVAPTIDGAAGTTNAGTWKAETKTWTGCDKKVSFTTSGTAGNLGFKSITVYFEEGVTVYKALHLVAKKDDGYYATFSSSDVTFFSEDYIVSAVGVENGELYQFDNEEAFDDDIRDINSDEVTGYYVPANTGVLVYSLDPIVKYLTVSGVTPNNDAEAVNMLRPASVAMTGDFNFYKLAYDNFDAKSGLGFYWGAADGAAFTCKAGTAYLAVPKSIASNLRGFRFDEEGCTTGIESIVAGKSNGEIYNLQGQRIRRLQQGVNIVNGKKVIR